MKDIAIDGFYIYKVPNKLAKELKKEYLKGKAKGKGETVRFYDLKEEVRQNCKLILVLDDGYL